jgi:hypothetical protein
MSQLQDPPRWLLLLHQIPPSPPYFRAKVVRRLARLGALPIKNSAYILPETDETVEDLQWLRSEIAKEGGEAWLFRTETLGGITNAQMVESFQAARRVEFKQLLDSAKVLRQCTEPEKHLELRKLKRQFEELRRIDFFGAPGREELENMFEKIERRLHGAAAQVAEKPELASLRGRTWVTRCGVKVDRIASAWLIRRFIDRDAKFRFVDQDRYKHATSEIRFDMFEGEFTHEGDLCTFESLLRHVKLQDAALEAIAEIIHDIDLKDDKYQRGETSGIAAMISGITALETDDERRIAEGSRMFDAVYAGLRSKRKA